ncbi:MAG TPA: FAD-dependent monooxygenase, partial [Afifellaceae bacterium]|nr:FAD-dependent monooxygenase [Afifellaceae bacterium]
MTGKARHRDIVIAGGGTAGLAAALAMRKAAPDLAITIVDIREFSGRSDGNSADQRASAIAAAAQRMLEALGVWPAVAGEAQPIASMEVTDSRTGDAARPVFLTFDGTVEEGKPFAHMVPNAVLLSALTTAVKAAGVEMIAPDSVDRFDVLPERVDITLGSGKTIDARLLIAADGVRSRLRALAGIKTTAWRYSQMAIVTNVRHGRPHGGVAIEHFLPAGPFASLPLTGNRSSIVWTEQADDARRLLKSDDFVFLAELERRFGHRFGAIELDGPRQGYPLGLILARDFVQSRFALLGDAAHAIHPIAGQGLNLSFRDVAALGETVIDAYRLGLDFGTFGVLERYQAWRRF